MKRTIPLILAVALSAPALGLALGIRIPDQDTFATARAEAVTATADNPSAIYYNPAGITQLSGQNILLGSYSTYFQTKYTSAGTSVRTKDKPQAVPQIYYTYSLKDTPITFGLGIYSPYGFSLEYPDANPFRTMALKAGVTYITLNPVIAWKINDQLSVAAGPTFNYADSELKFGLFPAAGNSFTFKGDGYATGFNAGILWQPAKEHSFGISYHSGTSIGLNGHSTASIPGFLYQVNNADAQFDFPEFIMAGYSYRPTPEWNFEFDVDWTNWQNLNTVVLTRQNSSSIALPFNWSSSFMYKLGATRYFSNGYNLSAGYIYSENSVPNQSFSPIVPDSDRHILSVGVGKKYDRLSWDLAYQFAYGPTRSVSNGTPANGDYRFISHAISLSLGYHF
jgi:long-chain fatty acid transport protein